MKSIKYILSIILISVLASSCQKVITIDLNSANPLYVIDAKLSDQPGMDTVKISKTANYFGNNVFPAVTGASVVITNDKGVSDTLTSVSPGVYYKKGLSGTSGSTYNIIVKANGNTFKASTTMPAKVFIDSLVSGPIRNPFRKVTGFSVTCKFRDPAGISNYYRLKEYVNDSLYDNGNAHLFSDKYSDGNSVSYTLNHKVFPGDVVKVELLCIDKATYDFYNSLNTTISGGATSVSPANPTSNFGVSALGYFGAYTVDSRTIVVK